MDFVGRFFFQCLSLQRFPGIPDLLRIAVLQRISYLEVDDVKPGLPLAFFLRNALACRHHYINLVIIRKQFAHVTESPVDIQTERLAEITIFTADDHDAAVILFLGLQDDFQMPDMARGERSENDADPATA
ncbi:hypothetical protein SDC9_162562 [bioreactor metagenome]|uniref:Uncharacterized protein n=1 Tax=bioreactor metagenome TaxID=1076179 RepID=A0A645FNS4_9ZZZZ